MKARCERTEDEIEDVRDLCMEQESAGSSRWPGMTYEQGVAAAIAWLLGENDHNPMEE